MTTDSTPLPSRRRLLAAAGLAASALVGGCQPLSFFKAKPPEKIEAKADAYDPAAAPKKHQVRVAPYVFLSDFEIPRDQPLFAELADLRDVVMKELHLPPATTTVEVYLFDTRDRYERYMKGRFPTLPARRAFFVAQPRPGGEDLLVFTYWGPRIRQDLRHELTHALLHTAIREVPQWLDEGLAEYFELPPESKGLNSAHLDALRRNVEAGTYKCSLARLEKLTEVEDMSPAEYREAWAWVHLMLHSGPEAKGVLLGYLQELRGTRKAASLRVKLAKVFADPEKALGEHLEKIAVRVARGKATR